MKPQQESQSASLPLSPFRRNEKKTALAKEEEVPHQSARAASKQVVSQRFKASPEMATTTTTPFMVSNWFENLKGSPHSSSSSIDSIPASFHCPASTNAAYSTVGKELTETDAASDNLQWCKESRDHFNVVLGRSWGALPRDRQKLWDVRKCNELLALGKLQSCDQRFGWPFITEWLEKPKINSIIKGFSDVSCASNVKASTFCRLVNVQLDFSKIYVSGKQRSFELGFLKTFGKKVAQFSAPEVPGRQHIETSHSRPTSSLSDPLAAESRPSEMKCDEIETRPTFIVSNDDIYNLGHYINDVMGVWAAVVMANKDSKGALLINIDGVRPGGPAGGPPHRLMEANDPDKHGPYIG